MLPKTQTIADPFDTFLSSPVVAQGVVYFGSGDGNLYAVDAATGEGRWKFKTGDVVHASPAYANGVLFFGSWDSYFYAVDAATGKEKWRFHGGEDDLLHNQIGFQSSPAVVDGVVYTGCRDAQLYALDAATGKQKWKFDNQLSWVISSPAVADGKVYFATSDSALYHVVEAASGKPLLKQQSKAYMFSSPTVAGDVVLIGVLNGTLEARDLKTGALLWDHQTETSKANKGWILDERSKIQSTDDRDLELAGSADRRDGSTIQYRRDFFVAVSRGRRRLLRKYGRISLRVGMMEGRSSQARSPNASTKRGGYKRLDIATSSCLRRGGNLPRPLRRLSPGRPCLRQDAGCRRLRIRGAILPRSNSRP